MDDNFFDNFEKDREEPVPEPHVETPQEREERELAEATIERRHDTLRLMLVSAIVLMVLLLGGWVWARYLHPCAQGTERGYVMRVRSEGSLVKTVEGRLLSQRMVSDTLVMESDFRFTLKDDSLTAIAKAVEGRGRLVVLTYEQYHAMMPWTGSSNCIVTAIDTTDAAAVDTSRLAARRPFIP